MNKIRCLECTNISMRESPKHANEGLGRCKLNLTSGEFESILYRRECKDYQRADEEKILRRYAWQDQLKTYRRLEPGT